MKSRSVAILISLAFVGSIEQARADLVFDSGSRSVFTAATYAAPDGGSTTGAGLYIDSATSSGAGIGGGTLAHASQSSLTPATTGPAMSGSAGSTSTITATGLDGYSVTAVSTFMVDFHVNVDGPYSFNASTAWFGDVPPFATGTSHALVEFRDVTNSIVLALTFRSFALQGLAGTSAIVPLETGIDYRITAHTGVGGGAAIPGSFSADSGFSFDLAAVPEAGSVAMMTLGTLLAAAIAWWKRKK